MRQVTAALSGLLAVCVAVRIAAWLIAPAWPIIIILLALLGLFRLILGRSFRAL